MKRWLLVLLIALSFVTQFQLQVAVSVGESQYFTSYHQAVNHDIAFGALLPLHSRDKGGICGSPKRQEGFLWLHALQYAVEDVNRKWDARRFNASLTLTVCDTCNDEQIALEQALDLAYTYRKKLGGGDDLKPVLGVISSSQNKDASTLLGLFKVPQIIFGKDNNTPDSPGDILQSVSIGYYKARALADLVKYFTWSAVSVVYSTEHQDDFEIFLRISNIEKLCVAVKVLLSGEGTHSVSYEQTIVKLLSEPASTIVILFTDDRETKKILKSKCLGRRHALLTKYNEFSIFFLHLVRIPTAKINCPSTGTGQVFRSFRFPTQSLTTYKIAWSKIRRETDPTLLADGSLDNRWRRTISFVYYGVF